MHYQTQYTAKKCSPEYAISQISSDDRVLIAGEPGALLRALYQARERFTGLRLFSVFGFSGIAGTYMYTPEMAGHIEAISMLLNANAGEAWMRGAADLAMANLSEAEQYLAENAMPTVLLAHCAPPDEHGYLYLGTDAGCFTVALERGAKVFVQVNENMPLICSDYARIHVSAVTAVCEFTEPLPTAPARDAALADEDKTIAGIIAERIPNGATIQLGSGPLPDIVGRSLDHHKDLGAHTDCFGSAMIHLMKKGALNNSKKDILPGISVGGYFRAPTEELQYLHKNRQVMMKKLSWVCDPAVMSKMKGLVSVNMGLAVDFRAHVCSGCLGDGFIGGVGSQHDFARGAKRATDGKSFIVMRSTRLAADGSRTSAILPALPDGSLVSIPRCDIMYVVTEYGAANLRDMGVKERVNALISLAHPDFRDWLKEEAGKHGYC